MENCGQKTGQCALHITRTTPMKATFALHKRKRIDPVCGIRDGVGVTDKGEIDLVSVSAGYWSCDEIGLENTGMTVKAFPLSHSNLTSTAFLISNKNNYLLYLGDTGPDEIEKSQNLHLLWEAIAPLIKAKQLKAIMIEVSFPNEQPAKNLFGHLTPRWLMHEMNELAKLTGKDVLQGFNIIVTHVKPPEQNIIKLKQQLKAENKLGLNLIFPVQGKRLDF